MKNRRSARVRSDFAAALIVVVLALIPGSAGAESAKGPYGSWEIMKMERGGTAYEIIMTIEESRIRMTSRCSHQDDIVEVEVSSALQITDGELRITESDRREKEHSPGYLTCRAAISPKNLGYEMRDGKLVLNDPQRPQPMVLSRTEL